jgi:type III restriction enzyme
MAESSYLPYAAKLPGVEDRDPYSIPKEFVRYPLGSDIPEVVPERRPSEMLCVNRIREAVDAWRDADYDGASSTTQKLFRWWFEEAEIHGFRPYWGQREAIETLAYLVEVDGGSNAASLIEAYQDVPDPDLLRHGIEFNTTADGVRQIIRARAGGGNDVIDLPADDLSRYAFKMATGTGKTLVMALATVWSYFHARRESDSPMSTNMLIVAPNVIVFERLRKDFENAWVFHELAIVPPSWTLDLQVILRGESTEPSGSATLFLTNIQQLYESGSATWTPKNAIDRLLGRKPAGDPAQGRRMLERIRSVDTLFVMNDEAHHVHDSDLEWNKTLEALHRGLSKGVSAWLDFSATPKFQTGVYFPWIVCDYPLAQAVEDRIVKSPVILHMVDKPDPGEVTASTVVDKYHDWLVAGVAQIRKHIAKHREWDTKPVLFAMCEKVDHADAIGAWMRDPAGGGFDEDEVLVIHTKNDGDYSVDEKKLDELRRQAAAVDDPESPIKVVVSVLVLREGWDVRNVTIVMGLRPGTAEAKILPEQAVGRGLRLMLRDGQPMPDQVLEVLGTAAFENFVRQLEAEGVHIDTEKNPPKLPITIAPTDSRKKYDITIPRTGTFLVRKYSKLEELQVAELDPLFDPPDGSGASTIRLRAEAAAHGVTLGVIEVEDGRLPLAGEVVAGVVTRTQSAAQLTGEFARLYPLIQAYLETRCFGVDVDLESDEGARRTLGRPDVQSGVATYLASEIGRLVAEVEPITLEQKPIRLSETAPFPWRRERVECERTVFNFVATYNAFESAFAEFLDSCSDVARFAALEQTGFKLQYVKPSGATGLYFPDSVVVQKTDDGEVNWIIETKGRVWEGTERKDAAVKYWCEQVSEHADEPWVYVRINQTMFESAPWSSFAQLVEAALAAED